MENHRIDFQNQAKSYKNIARVIIHWVIECIFIISIHYIYCIDQGNGI